MLIKNYESKIKLLEYNKLNDKNKEKGNLFEN